MATRHILDTLDPADLTPDQRLAAVAAILARGVLHLQLRAAAPTSLDPQNPPESS